MEYLQDYLSVLPAYDRNVVEQMIQENEDLFETKVTSKEEFEALLQQLANRIEMVTSLESTGEQMDAEHFNNMHANVNLDLKRLYNSHLIVEKVMANYERILKGTLEEVEREIDALATRVEELSLKAKGEDGLIIKTFHFEEKEKTSYLETKTDDNTSLFKDRDKTTDLPMAEMNRSYHKHYLSLPVKEVENALHDKSGNKIASLEIVYEPLNTIKDSNHPISHAIDESTQTYWAQAVTTDAPAYTEITKR